MYAVFKQIIGHHSYVDIGTQIPALPVQPSAVMSPPLQLQSEALPPRIGPEGLSQNILTTVNSAMAMDHGLALQSTGYLQTQPDNHQPLGQQVQTSCPVIPLTTESSQEVLLVSYYLILGVLTMRKHTDTFEGMFWIMSWWIQLL